MRVSGWASWNESSGTVQELDALLRHLGERGHGGGTVDRVRHVVGAGGVEHLRAGLGGHQVGLVGGYQESGLRREIVDVALVLFVADVILLPAEAAAREILEAAVDQVKANLVVPPTVLVVGVEHSGRRVGDVAVRDYPHLASEAVRHLGDGLDWVAVLVHAHGAVVRLRAAGDRRPCGGRVRHERRRGAGARCGMVRQVVAGELAAAYLP